MNIVIVGGGTAGWLSALFIKKIHPNNEVTVIESSKIGIIGAGEASTGLLRGVVNNVIWDFGCNEIDFMSYSHATPKLGIDYINWSGDGKNYIAPIDSSIKNYTFGTDFPLTINVAKNNEIHNSSLCGQMIDMNLSSFYVENGMVLNSNMHSYLFDARLAGEYFKSICSDVKIIDAIVTEINLDDSGKVISIDLDNESTVIGDFFIDASGFARIFSKKMGVQWKDYSSEMVVNAAMPFILPHEKNVRPLIEIHALDHGWMWKTPRLYDYGCGMVYNSSIISDSDIKKEVEAYLGIEISPIKFLKFNPGRLENSWNKNVLSVGLASSFLEPLEGTSIHGTIAQLAIFSLNYLKKSLSDTVTEGSIDRYNSYINNMYEDFKNFVLIHYTGRQDTEFWKQSNKKAMSNNFVSSLISMSKSRLCNFSDVPQYYGSPGPGLYNWCLAGLGHFNKEAAEKELNNFNYDENIKKWELETNYFFSDKQWIDNRILIDFLKNRS